MRILRSLPLLLIVLALRLSAAPAVAPPATGMSRRQTREHLLVHFEMTGQVLAEQVRGALPRAQLELQGLPSQMRWSIRECVLSSGRRRTRLLAGAI